ncbi:MAG: hypothetical protein ABIG45_05240 [Bacillota bacterium]
MRIEALLLLFSFYGIAAFLNRRAKISSFAAPLAAACAIILFVYGFGLIGLLKIGLFAVTGIGVLLGVHTLCTAPKTFLHWSAALGLAACALLWLRYHDALLLQYDDFSHWGLIARHLLTHDALPDQSSVLIQFQSYPPGAACWIYAVCFFFGQGEGMMITAQAWLTLIALLPLFAVSEKNSAVRCAGIAALIVVVLSVYQGTASLMVDNLLAAVSIGAAAIAVHMRKSPRRGAWPLAAVLAVLCLIKDSGLFFAALVLGLQLCLLRRGRYSFKALLPPLLFSAAVRLAWWAHIQTAFSAAGLTKHAFTFENMRSVSADRTWDNLVAIGKAVLRNALSFHNHSLQMLGWMLLCCAAIAVLRCVAKRRWSFAREWKLLLGCAVSYGLYLLLLLGMYFFTMPLHAALEAVAFERYNITFALFVYGLFAVYLLLIPPNSLLFARAMPLALACMLALPVALPSYRGGVRRLISETYRVPIREQIDALEHKRPLLLTESAALYIGDQPVQRDFAAYIAAYTFRQQVPVYTNETLNPDALPDVLYALFADDTIITLTDQKAAEIVVP